MRNLLGLGCFISCVTFKSLPGESSPELSGIDTRFEQQLEEQPALFCRAVSTGKLMLDLGAKSCTPLRIWLLLQCLLMLQSTALCLLEGSE